MKKIYLISITVFLPMFFLSIGKSQNLEVQDTLNEGTYLEFIMHSPSLEDNFLGDSPDREVSVYLPPGYYSSPDKHYPVIYFLHSYTLDHTAFFGGYPWYTVDFKTICDDLIDSREIESVIVVSPNSYNKYWGSFYTNSLVTGNWADFIVRDIINYIDNNFRTLPQRESRGLAGHSMGGYGTLWLIMNYPSVFNAAYMLSGHPELEELYLENLRDNMIAASNAENLAGLDWRKVVCIAAAAAFAPDTLVPPFYAQFPLDDSGVLIDSIWDKWLKHDPLYLLPSYKDSLMQLKAIQFDVGTNDSDAGFITGNRNFSQALNDLGIPHTFEEYDGDHTNKLAERIETKLLPFFSANLSKHLLTDTVNIPDTAFLYALIDEDVDTNGDGLISYNEAEAIISLDVTHRAGRREITDMTGIEAFVNLDTLNCGMNDFTSLDLSGNPSLKYLDCSGYFVYYTTPLITLDVSNNALLEYLDCGSCRLTSLDVSNNTVLTYLECSLNQLTSLDVSNNTALTSLSCAMNQLTSLNVSNNTALKGLACIANQLTSLNVSNNIALTNLTCDNNQLTSLNISNNKSIQWLEVESMSTLKEICVWTMPFPPEGVHVATQGSPNIYYTTECSTTGIDGRSLPGLSIYPNPATNLLTIETKSLEQYNIEITSLNGQLLYTDKIEGPTHQINLSSFQKGLYLITIRSRDYVRMEKIIKL